MTSLGHRPALAALAMLIGITTSACRPTLVVVPHPAGQYTAADTLYGTRNGGDVRVTFRVDTILRVDTVSLVDTAWVRGTRTLVRVDTVLRVDTVRVRVPATTVRTDTVLRVDTVRVRAPAPIVRTDTVLRVDTVRVRAPAPIVRTDTVLRVDTLRLVVTDTVVRTVRVPGRRMLFVPPGHYPPEGQCRVWLHDQPPGQQARPSACAALGPVPEGAFVLFGGEAWDFDYDWIGEAEARPGSVPREIVALKRNR